MLLLLLLLSVKNPCSARMTIGSENVIAFKGSMPKQGRYQFMVNMIKSRTLKFLCSHLLSSFVDECYSSLGSMHENR